MTIETKHWKWFAGGVGCALLLWVALWVTDRGILVASEDLVKDVGSIEPLLIIEGKECRYLIGPTIYHVTLRYAENRCPTTMRIPY